jgi:hypothetical protein
MEMDVPNFIHALIICGIVYGIGVPVFWFLAGRYSNAFLISAEGDEIYVGFLWPLVLIFLGPGWIVGRGKHSRRSKES